MSTDKPRTLVRLEYERAAEAYLRSLPPEHFMEAVPQATQRKVTLESLDLAHIHRSDIQTFNELVVQYRYGRDEVIRHVVPDNMVVVHDEPIHAVGSYIVALQPARPFWVMEYVSKSSQRKDYEDSFRKYERELKVRYYLLFYPDEQELTLFRHNGRKYRTVQANEADRYPIPELELELGLLDGWVRFWFRGELLPLPADLQRELEDTRRQLLRTQEQARRAQEQARQAEEQARLAQEQARQAEEQARRAREEAEHERQQKERLLAQLRELGIEPRL
jgi:flagellar biosynthesis GTPase FlhF